MNATHAEFGVKSRIFIPSFMIAGLFGFHRVIIMLATGREQEQDNQYDGKFFHPLEPENNSFYSNWINLT
jgi:hypothetical protein